MIRKFKNAIIMGTFLCALSLKSLGAEAAGVRIELNLEKAPGVNTIMENDVTLVPLRYIGDLLDVTTDWDQINRTITLTQGSIVNELTIDSTTAYKQIGDSRSEIELRYAPTIKDEVTYVPLRYIAESLDIEVEWDKQTQTIRINEAIGYKDEKIYFGSDKEKIVSLLGEPSYIMKDEIYDYLFYADDYKNVIVLYTVKDKMVGFSTNAETMKYRDLTYKSQGVEEISGLDTVLDGYDGDKLVGMGYNMLSSPQLTSDALLANERIIFELTNGFRIHHDKEPVTYSSKISEVARAHSRDMAEKGYFSHTGLDGSSPGDRLRRGLIKWDAYGENLATSNASALLSFGQWVNSLSHREAMLNQIGQLGVGSAYNPNDQYGYYHTQNFVLSGIIY